MADTKISDEIAASTLTGAEILPVVQSSANRRTTSAEIARLRGLFGPQMSGVPTIAGSGFGTWVNQGSATIADTPSGVRIIAPSNANAQSLRARTKAAPTPPYTATALFAMAPAAFNEFSNTFFGFSDGTKFQLIELSQRQTSPSPILIVDSYQTSGSIGTGVVHFTGAISAIGYLVWFQLADDGTNVAFRWCADGQNFRDYYTVAKASGYLANYNTLVWGLNPFNTATTGVMMDYKEA